MLISIHSAGSIKSDCYSARALVVYIVTDITDSVI